MGAKDIIETQQTLQVGMLEEALTDIRGRYDTVEFELQERLADLDRVMGSSSAQDFMAQYSSEGPDLDQLVRRSNQIRVAVTLNPHVKRGLRLRTSYVWSDAVEYTGVPGLNGEPTGRGVANVAGRFLNPLNQRYVFGSQAREEREAALYTDGGFLLLGEDSSKTLRPFPLSQISGLYANDEDPSEVWAYRRLWYTDNGVTPHVEWVFTDLFKSKQVASIRYNGVLEPVAVGKTVIDGWVNTQPGWALGFPDAGCIIEWARIYSEFIKSGKIMTDAMARIWATVKAQSGTGGKQVAAKIADATGYGKTAVGNELAPLSTAGKAYDFDAGRALISIVATGVEVSVVHLTSDPGASGGSYGSAATLDLPTRLAVEARRRWHEEFDTRVLRWLGAANGKARFGIIEDGAELYRKIQAVVLKWNTGLYEPVEIKRELEMLVGHADGWADIPEGVLIPNNIRSIARQDIDADVAATVAAPDQGQSNGTGSMAGLGMDLRSDTIN